MLTYVPLLSVCIFCKSSTFRTKAYLGNFILQAQRKSSDWTIGLWVYPIHTGEDKKVFPPFWKEHKNFIFLHVSSERKHHYLYALFLQTLSPSAFCLVVKFLNMKWNMRLTVSSLLMVKVALLLYDSEILWSPSVKIRSIAQNGKQSVGVCLWHKVFYFIFAKWSINTLKLICCTKSEQSTKNLPRWRDKG